MPKFEARIGFRSKLGALLVGLPFLCAPASAQSAFNGQITPGVSMRRDVDQALGAPISQVNATLLEYKPLSGASRLQVQFRADGTVDSINAGFAQAFSRDAMVQALGLPGQPQSTQVAQGRLIEYFGAPAYLVFLYGSAQAGSGVVALRYDSAAAFAMEAPPLQATSSTGAEAAMAAPVPRWQIAAGSVKRFDAASVRLNHSNSGQSASNFPLGPGDVYAPSGGVFSATGMPLVVLISFAYKASNSEVQLLDSQLSAWAATDRYDIEARSADGNASKDQMRLMMQSLLADRFRLAIHSEVRQVPLFGLVLSTPGATRPGLQPHPDGAICSTAPSSAEAGLFPATCGGISGMPPSTPGDVRWGARNVSIDLIAQTLSGADGEIDRPIVDRTGLRGTFDFALEWTPNLGVSSPGGATAEPGPHGPGLIRALNDQLGLRLEPTNGPQRVLVIDHIERPAENLRQ